MVKNSLSFQNQKSSQSIEELPIEREREEQITNLAPKKHQKIPFNQGLKQIPKIGRTCSLNDSSTIFENLAIGCVINFLRKFSPSPIENIVEHVKSNEHSLINSVKGKYKKNAFQTVDYVLTWYPKIFKLNDSFHYYLNEEEALKYERGFKLKTILLSKNKRLKYKEKIKQQREKSEKKKRISEKIEAELSNGAEPSIITKAYLVLTSSNEKEAESLRLKIRNAYLTLKNLV